MSPFSHSYAPGSVWLAVLLPLSVLTVNPAAGQGSFMYSIPAYLSGGGQVPPNDSPHIAYAIFQYEGGSTQVVAQVKCPPTFDTAVAARVHGPAHPFDLGPLVADLGQFNLVTNITPIISWPDSIVYITNISYVSSNLMNLGPQQMEELEHGQYYVLVTSTNLPEGEIRAQITRSPILSQPRLDGSGGLVFDATGSLPASGFAAEVSTNLTHWSVLTNALETTIHSYPVPLPDSGFIFPGVTVEFMDPDGGNDQNRYYRVLGQ